MSTVALETVKQYLRVVQNSDDVLLQALVDAAEDQCLQYMGRDDMPTVGDVCACSTTTATTTDGDIAPVVIAAVCVVVQAHYDGDGPEAVDKARTTMQHLLAAYRCGLGV